jgi:hypothetical protein
MLRAARPPPAAILTTSPAQPPAEIDRRRDDDAQIAPDGGLADVGKRHDAPTMRTRDRMGQDHHHPRTGRPAARIGA